MRILSTTVVTVLLLLVVIGAPSHRDVVAPSADSGLVAATAVSIQEFSTLEKTASVSTKFWQNGSAEFATGSSKISIPFDAGGLTLASATGATLTLGYTFPNGYYPMVNVTQGLSCQIGVTCWNTTVPFTFTVNPSVSGTPVSTRIAAAFNISGLPVPMATYTVPLAYSSTVLITVLSNATWRVVNGTSETVSDPIVVPAGYTLNSTQVFVPWPGNATLNASSLNVTIGALNVTSIQTVAGGFYAVLPGLASNVTLKATARVAATSAGGWTTLKMGVAYLDGNGQQYQSNGSWVNKGLYPYGGGFLLTTNFTYAIDPTSINLTENGQYIKASHFFLAGTIVEVLPGTFVVSGGGVAAFVMKFFFLNAPPIYTASLTTPVIGTVNAGTVLVVGMVVTVMGVIIGAIQVRRTSIAFSLKNMNSAWWGCVFGFVFFAAVFFYLAFTGGGA